MTDDRSRETATVAASAIREVAERVKANIGRVIVGKDDVIDLVLVGLFSDGHLLIEDVPGIGKTTLAKSIARSIGCSFKRIQFTPDVMPSDITGINFYNQKQGEFEFRPGPIIANIVLADEINRATPRTQSALLEAMEERQVTVEGVTLPLPAPFLVIATQNPIELEGTFPLPEAQLDRFFMRIKLGYPSEADEDAILLRFEEGSPLTELEPVVTAEELTRLSRLVSQVYCEPSIRRYVVQVVQATRRHASYDLGASPRGSLSLFRGARALAAIRGRDYVLPDDVKFLAPYVLAHRAILSSQSRLRGRDAEGVLQEALESVPVPIEG
ncbi:MAG: AAA domain-containing protein [Dehalococcoidia bacterium]|nr:AAA domain-containing protein [Dehalococcoidia bacterium]